MPLLLFAPGAGAPSTSSWMKGWARRLSSVGRVVTFDYPYQWAGRKLPDRLPQLIEAHSEALRHARRDAEPVILVGKSMGSRVACHVAAAAGVQGVVCLGYPLQSAGRRATLRDAVLLEATTPVLFVQGTRDALCPLELLDDVRRRMRAPSTLHVVEDGDHSLLVRRRTLARQGRDQAAIDAGILAVIAAFADSVTRTPG